ncbi:MAG: hypothetical protein QG597_392 [Actinomycetota bacterium]|nr:hypothetical protein [Actinomycetota bacterium]
MAGEVDERDSRGQGLGWPESPDPHAEQVAPVDGNSEPGLGWPLTGDGLHPLNEQGER